MKHRLSSKQIATDMLKDATGIQYKFDRLYGYQSAIVDVYGHRYKITGIHTNNPTITQLDVSKK